MKIYTILKTDSFSPGLFPEVVKELAAIHTSLEEHDTVHKSDIVISFFKDHSIQMEWIPGNGQLIRTITSPYRSSSHIESLFDSARENKGFLNGFERYIKKQLHTEPSWF